MSEDNSNDQDFAAEITAFLNDADYCESSESARLNKLIYSHLKNIARNRMAGEGRGGTITVSDLVNEAFIKLDGVHSLTWKSRRHYYGAAAEAMRRILIDRARYKKRSKREAQLNVVELDEEIHITGVNTAELVQLDDALNDLEAMESELASVIKLNYFGGLPVKDIAELLDMSPRTVARKLQTARAWLLTQMKVF